MTADELAVLKAQQQLRAELEARCQEKGWSLDEVFYSNLEFHVDPNRPDFVWSSTWPPKAEKPKWVTDANRQKPVIAPLQLSRQKP